MSEEGEAAQIAKRITEAGATAVVTSWDNSKSEFNTQITMVQPACTGTGVTQLEALTNAETAFKVYLASHGE
jgi:hypothetical protein